ncbi:hypothetical protein ULO1_19050 [Carboxydocella sp. ULO1]|nr:hypothetical protein ULO1_19050 [Carboxydocella sp. ULO1]
MRVREVKSPQTVDYLESIRYCQLMFDLSNYEVREITQKLLDHSLIAPNEMHYLVLKEDEELVGYAVYYYLQDLQLAFLDYIGILPAFQSQGYGARLYQAMLQEIRQQHPEAQGLIMEVKSTDDDFDRRCRFFQRLGASLIDLQSMDVPAKLKESGLVLMIHPFQQDLQLDREMLMRFFRVLARTLWH